MMDRLFWVHFYFCGFMTGVIWLVQIVQYPGFHAVGEGEFKTFHQAHSSRIGFIVGPAMAIELLTGFQLLLKFWNLFWSIQLAMLVMIWLCTAFVSVPLHGLLGRGKSTNHIRLLVGSNWIRTALWTVRSISMIALVLEPQGLADMLKVVIAVRLPFGSSS